MENIIFRDEDDEEIEFAVVDQITVNDTRYILVIEEDVDEEDEVEAVILREQAGSEDDEEVIYELIEDEDEYMDVLDRFKLSNEDFDFDYPENE